MNQTQCLCAENTNPNKEAVSLEKQPISPFRETSQPCRTSGLVLAT